MPEFMRNAKNINQDKTVERPAKKIARFDDDGSEPNSEENADLPQTEPEKTDDALSEGTVSDVEDNSEN